MLILFQFFFIVFFATYQQGAQTYQGKCLFFFMCFGSLVGGLFPATAFSRAFNLSLCSFNSNSTLKNPAQYNTIDKTEIKVAKEGKLSF